MPQEHAHGSLLDLFRKKVLQQKLKKSHKIRAAIEPVIGHIKNQRLSRNFYKEDSGDAINVLLAAAAFNFKRIMNNFFLLFY